MANLAGMALKLNRARDHLADLEGQMEALYLPGTIRLEHSTLDNGRVHSYAIQGLPIIPDEWAPAIGDCIHNARSALDHLAHEVVISFGGTPVYGPGGTSFPITEKPGKGIRLAGLPNLPSGLLDVLESIQPRAQQQTFIPLFLGVLGELDNRDKHRRLLLVQYVNNRDALAWGGNVTTPRPVVDVVETGFQNGDEVVRLTYPAPVTQFDPSPRLPVHPLLEPDLPLWKTRESMPVHRLLHNVIESAARAARKVEAVLP